MSDATPILHMISPTKHVSPFDVNMAVDAGWTTVVPYINVEHGEVADLVQDAIFSRPPDAGIRTGIFFAGEDALLALDMMDAAKDSLVDPFKLSTFADPAGSFTTAAAMVACVEKTLKDEFNETLKGKTIPIFGATGVVGFASSVIAALEGANVQLVAHRGIERCYKRAEISKEKFGVDLESKHGETEEQKAELIKNADIVFAAAAAGVQVLSKENMAEAKNLMITADVNAVPPPGVEGMTPFMNGEVLPGLKKTLGIGPLAIGDVKYKVESGLFKRMLESTKPIHLDFRHAFELAREVVNSK